MVEIQDQAWANPSSLHGFGLKASEALERSRVQIADKLNADFRDVVFTSGATESVHLALHGLAGLHSPGRLVISSVEHPAVSGAAHQLFRNGWEVVEWPVDQLGRIRLERLDELLSPPTRIVSLVWGQGEIGTIQPLLSVAEACRQRGILIHTDATQVLSQGLPNWNQLPVDLMSASAHKCGGPRGVGLLLVRESLRCELKPLLSGGGQEAGLRSGTESVVLAAGMAAALAQIERSNPDQLAGAGNGIADLRNALRDRLLMDERLVVCGDPDQRLPHHLSLLVSDHNGQPVSGRQLVRSLDAQGLAVSSGSACSSGKDSDSPVLTAMDLPQTMRRSSVRLSLGPWISAGDLDGITERFFHGLEDVNNS